MRVFPDKNRIFWLLMLIVVVAAIVIYRIGFHIPIQAFDEEALSSTVNISQQVIETGN
jgi:preprotein translocase subunit SecY